MTGKTNLDNSDVENVASQQAATKAEATLEESIVLNKETVESLERASLNIDQEEVPVYHHFGPGVYIREVRLKAGLFAIGHAQRNDQMNIMLSGVVNVYEEDGIRQISAPLMYVGKKGRKVGYIVEDTVWLNVYNNPTDERDIDKLEDMFLDKSDTWQCVNSSYAKRHKDIEDFNEFTRQFNIDQDLIKSQSENAEDQIPMPSDYSSKISVRKSKIEGMGLFANAPINKGENIGPARISGFRTPIGRFTNHAKEPNCKFLKDDCENISLIAIMDIKGCVGGGSGTELTVDYRQALELSGIYKKDLK